MGFKHHDEARADTVAALIKWLRDSRESRIALIDDLYGRYRLILWPGRETKEAAVALLKGMAGEAAGSYWSDQLWVVTPETSELDRKVYEGAWEEGRPRPEEARLRIVDRFRNRVAWFAELSDPPWKARGRGEHGGPPIVVFYSFKGGVGRTTALASFAIARAQAGQRVVVIDGDLDAPGIGQLFSAEKPRPGQAGRTPGEAGESELQAEGERSDMESPAFLGSRWGLADYLLEGPSPEDVALSEYYESVHSEAIVPGNGEILVFPAGRVDENYLAKVARLDFDPALKGTSDHWSQLLGRIRGELSPDWILIDSRAGLGEPAGLLLGGLAHLHVLLGTTSEQSWQGTRLILDRLGFRRVCQGKPQAECVLVQAMVPESAGAALEAKGAFLARAENEFVAHYYAQDPEDPDEDSMWFIRDMPGKEAPHQPVCLSYRQKLAYFDNLEQVLPELLGEEYRGLAKRIENRFVEEVE
jgi:hypothetical protein